MPQTVTLPVADGSSMNAYCATPQGDGPFPAIIVLQEAYGVNSHIRFVADRIASEGFVTIAPELFHRTAPKGFEAGYNDFPQVQPHLQAVTIEGLEADLQASYDWLQQQENVNKEKIGSIGFCLGGRASFLANTLLPLSASVSYYGGGTHTLLDRVDKLHAPHLFFWGGKDQHIKPGHVEAVVKALKESGKPYINVDISYADHGFFCNERSAYNADAAQESWGITRTFFKNKLGTAPQK